MTIKRFCYQKMRVFNVLTLILLASTLLSCGPAGRAFWLGEPSGVKYSVNVDGYWSNWWREDFAFYGIFRSCGDVITDGVSDYAIFPQRELPSNYFLRIHIDNYSQNANIFDGWVEYYVSETYPTVKSFFSEAYKGGRLRVFPRPQWSENTVKRRAKATIRVVERYRKNPTVLNCWFDNVGLGIDLTMVSWNG